MAVEQDAGPDIADGAGKRQQPDGRRRRRQQREEHARVQIRGSYRATSHPRIFQLMLACDVWQLVGVEMVSFDFIRSARQAEGLLLEGEIDFISGNHVSPYTRYLSGSAIVYIASPSNGVRMVLASRGPLSDLSQVRGLRLGPNLLSWLRRLRSQSVKRRCRANGRGRRDPSGDDRR